MTKQIEAIKQKLDKKGAGRRIWSGTTTPYGSRGFRFNPRYTENYPMSEAETINREKGKHFFDPSAKRFFNSRISESGIRKGNEVYFTTSEKFDYNSPRKYSVRKMNLKTGEVGEVSEFQAYDTSSQARRALVKAAK